MVLCANSLPGFLVIGAARSGTTALATFLNRHPEIHIPFKEPHFFSGIHVRDFDGPGWPGTPDPRVLCRDLQEYSRIFEEPGEAWLMGEASMTYLPDRLAAQRIHDGLPEVKLIAVLRQPVERAFAHFVLFRDIGLEPERQFESALEQELAGARDRWTPQLRYLENGRYVQQIATYLELFPRSRFEIFLYDDWRDRPLYTWRAILEFLEVEQKFTPDFAETINASSLASPAWKVARSISRRLIPRPVRRPVARRLSPWFSTRPILDPGQRLELTLRHFSEEIERLAELLGRDLQHWLE